MSTISYERFHISAVAEHALLALFLRGRGFMKAHLRRHGDRP
jgi:hypothetical protein